MNISIEQKIQKLINKPIKREVAAARERTAALLVNAEREINLITQIQQRKKAIILALVVAAMDKGIDKCIENNISLTLARDREQSLNINSGVRAETRALAAQIMLEIVEIGKGKGVLVKKLKFTVHGHQAFIYADFSPYCGSITIIHLKTNDISLTACEALSSTVPTWAAIATIPLTSIAIIENIFVKKKDVSEIPIPIVLLGGAIAGITITGIALTGLFVPITLMYIFSHFGVNLPDIVYYFISMANTSGLVYAMSLIYHPVLNNMTDNKIINLDNPCIKAQEKIFNQCIEKTTSFVQSIANRVGYNEVSESINL